MKTYTTWLFILIQLTGIAVAQTDFRPGYVVPKMGDTIYGELDFRGPLIMGRVCKFREAEGSKEIDFSPSELDAFRFTDNKYFVSRQVDGEAVFLEYLIKGEIDMYYLKDDNGDHYYFEKETVPLMEIPYEEGIKHNSENKEIFFKSTRHIGLLKYNMQDAPEVHSMVDQMVTPKRKTLMKLAKNYHEAVCEEGVECIIYEKSISPFWIALEPVWGLATYREYDQSVNEVGANIYFWFPSFNERFSLKTGVVMQPGTINEKGQTLSRIPLQVQYLVQGKRFTPRVAVGLNIYPRGTVLGTDLLHFFNLNLGANYRIYKNISLSALLSTEHSLFTKSDVAGRTWPSLAQALNVGLYIELK